MALTKQQLLDIAASTIGSCLAAISLLTRSVSPPLGKRFDAIWGITLIEDGADGPHKTPLQEAASVLSTAASILSIDQNGNVSGGAASGRPSPGGESTAVMEQLHKRWDGNATDNLPETEEQPGATAFVGGDDALIPALHPFAGAEVQGKDKNQEGSSFFGVTESAPAAPTKQRGGRRGLARLFRGHAAGPAAECGLADLVTRSSSATELVARPPSAVSLDPIDRRGLGRFGRLLGRKRAADDASLPASGPASLADAASECAAASSAAPAPSL